MNDTIPNHVAIIMDGNRRWAKERGLPSVVGHKKVAEEVLEPLVEYAAKKGIKYLTLWAFSTENWNRHPLEVKGIMQIFRHSLKTFGEKMHKKGIKIQTIGDLSKFAPDIQKEVERLTDLTKHNKRITIVFALNYGGRDEIVRAVNKVISDKQYAIRNQEEKHLTSHVSRVTEEEFSSYLDTIGVPDTELIVRTGGEQRMSGFLPWQSVYSEFYFAPWYMPDFTPEKLDEVLADFSARKRRFGR